MSRPRNCALDLLAFTLLLIPACVNSARVDVGGQCSGDTCSESAGCHEPSKEESRENFIIRFNSYELQEEHRRSLASSWRGEGSSWSWIPRHNRASEYPTDFGLVTSSASLGHVRSILGNLDFVKDVHYDKRIQGSLKWQPEGILKDLIMDTASFGEKQRDSSESSSGGVEHQQDSEASDGFQQDGFFLEAVDETMIKRPGRMTTRFMMEGEEFPAEDDINEVQRKKLLLEEWVEPYVDAGRRLGSLTGRGGGHHAMNTDRVNADDSGNRRSLLQPRPTVPDMMNAGVLWKKGFSGKGVRVGVFDTGINDKHPHIRNIRERTNWTHQQSLGDGLGHGSFVAGVIGGNYPQCPGFAPDMELVTFKVFTDDQISFTSWFLDAFNYAILSGVHIINLSIGGPDFMDHPFVDKILEITSNGMIMVSAIGNDGPHYGTLNNPADMPDVIGVGGIDKNDKIAGFSSRGMTTWELPLGSGRVKPDVVAYAKDIMGSSMHNGCRSLSGTSVASPVVAGAVTLLASTVPEEIRWKILNPASMKQALVEGADILKDINLYEQGNGRVNLEKSFKILQEYKPRASVIPAILDMTNCPYLWPYCKQAMYAGALPIIFNATIMNGMGLTGVLVSPPTYKADDTGGQHLQLKFEYSDVLWPWAGYLAILIRVGSSGSSYSGTASVTVSFTVQSPPAEGEADSHTSTVKLPVKVNIIPTPDRKKRVLWDQFHSIKYPPAYIPRDNLDIRHDVLDWHGDHLFTNFHGVYNHLRDQGYFLEVLSSPHTCFDAAKYGAILIVDAEEEYYPEEVGKLRMDIEEHGLNLIVFAEWYNLNSMHHMKFFDDNTRSWWTPATGGSNVPALNDLLEPYGITLGDAIISGSTSIGGQKVDIKSGADVAKMPAGSYLHKADMKTGGPGQAVNTANYGVLGVKPVGTNGGHVAVYSDSNCLDFSHMRSNCYDFLAKLLDRILEGTENGIADKATLLSSPYVRDNYEKPLRRRANFTAVSFVQQNPLRCYASSACELQDPPGCGDQAARSVRASVEEAGGKGLDSSQHGQATTLQGSAAPQGGIPPAVLRIGLVVCIVGLVSMVAIWVYRGRKRARQTRT